MGFGEMYEVIHKKDMPLPCKKHNPGSMTYSKIIYIVHEETLKRPFSNLGQLRQETCTTGRRIPLLESELFLLSATSWF